jgi:aspartate/methionine/tyrosine aminotransferase
MIQAAERLSLIKEYYFSTKLKELRDRIAEGQDIINLGIGNPDLTPSNETLETLTNEIIKENSHGYQPYNGIPELRDAFSIWYKNIYNVDINSENEILPLIGSKEGIMHISMAFLNSGDEVLIPNPSYPTYRSVTNIVGAKVIEYNLTESNNWEPDFKELETMDLRNVKIMWVNYPNMPTGASGSIELLKALVVFGKKHNILICNDNPYSLILHKKPMSIMEIEGAKDISIELNSLSKSHNMAGWRLGMLTSNPTFIKNIITIKSNMDSGIFKPIQLAAVKALSCTDSWYNTINKEYKMRKEIVLQILNLLECTYDKQQGGMFVWAKIPLLNTNAYEYSDYILNETKVFITPGSIFGSNGDQYIRISLCNSQKILSIVKKRIEQLINKNNGIN